MPRLFTGIEIPAEISERLALLRGGIPGARWIDKENYHLTLRFIGDVDYSIANDVAEALGRVDRYPLTLTIDGIGSLGTRKPHSIVARVQPTRPLLELQAEQERLMQRLGLPAEQRKFSPHITLARIRGANGRDLADYLYLRGGLVSRPFEVTRFVLFSARDSIGGGPYIAEEAYPLMRQAPANDGGFDGRAASA
ncbi:RNA 2',3'-cyclic phosphodiesterase [Bauldia litoralis]|uniref:RNA 2',3'-cyclic phosphodiesterase n=1 Tax=Bauldia litoralis TaxID=665467 RepID=A0A1G6ADU0_9HYPH|nr:RNA 2',3'-cyclic phosphodiesterase [Bauldia litoralis]SDB06569.1 2'-5' RNA ligase [Bauldia litoralis]